jgi:WD40 repeat protein
VRTGENTAPSNPVESSTAELPTTRPSPLVQSIEVAAITPGYDTLIEPLTPSAWLAVARGSADQRGQIERWSMQPGHPSMLSGSVPRTHDSIASDAYVLAPTGDLLARVSSWPSPSVLIYLYPNGALLQTLPIQQDSDPTARITSQVFGFLPTFDQKNPDRLLVHRRNEKTGTDSFEVWDPRANRRIKLIPVAPFERCVGTTAVSSDGLTLAVAARGDNALTAASQPPTLYLYDVSGGAGSQVKSKLPIAPLKTPGAVRPTGMAFSPDNSRLAMLFEENGTGLLVIYSISNRGLSQQSSRVFPPMPVSAPMSWDGSSITWVGKNALLLYGQLIIDATTGESAGNTGISAITSQRFTPPDMLQLTFRDSSGQQRIALLKLDIKQIDELTKVKK